MRELLVGTEENSVFPQQGVIDFIQKYNRKKELVARPGSKQLLIKSYLVMTTTPVGNLWQLGGLATA